MAPSRKARQSVDSMAEVTSPRATVFFLGEASATTSTSSTTYTI